MIAYCIVLAGAQCKMHCGNPRLPHLHSGSVEGFLRYGNGFGEMFFESVVQLLQAFWIARVVWMASNFFHPYQVGFDFLWDKLAIVPYGFTRADIVADAASDTLSLVDIRLPSHIHHYRARRTFTFANTATNAHRLIYPWHNNTHSLAIDLA